MKTAVDEIRDAILAEIETVPGARIREGMAILDYPLDVEWFAEKLAKRTGVFDHLYAEVLTGDMAAAMCGRKQTH